AAERGHKVTLVERGRRLGGQVLLAEKLPGRSEFGGVVTNLMRELELAGVAVETGIDADRRFIEERAPEAVILATGAAPRALPKDHAEEAQLVQAWAVVSGEANVGASVVIADWACDWVALGVAEMLARKGCRVRLASGGSVPGEQIQAIVRDQWIGDLHKLGVEMIPYARFFGADGETAFFQHMTSGEPILCESVDTVVINGPLQANRHLEETLAGFPRSMRVVGDAAQPRTVEEAILEGYEAGREI
ncbi:MAG: hypothetical protein AB7V53_03180, partial [Dongiaceae bacterium]